MSDRHAPIAAPSALTTGKLGLPMLRLESAKAEAHIYLHGAHVSHFQPRGQKPVLFMSDKSWFDPGKPIRGGVPLCFPWFGPNAHHPDLPAHGFARLMPWNLEHVEKNSDGAAVAVLTLESTDETLAMWPHEFEARFTVTLRDSLTMALCITNRSQQPASCEVALHTYLAVSDCRNVQITGLEGARYIDKVDNMAARTQGSDPITFTGETDRPYLDTTAASLLHDPGWDRTIEVAKEGSRSTVIWNPWIDKAQRMPDFGDNEWPHMVCIETANVATNHLTLKPGEHQTTTARITPGTSLQGIPT